MTSDDLLPVDDDGLDDIAAELGNMAPPRNGNVSGIVAASRDKIMLYEFREGGKADSTVVMNLETAVTKVQSLAFHNNRLWFGTAIDPVVSCDLKLEKASRPGKTYSQGADVLGLFSHNGVLYDSGEMGIDDTIAGERRLALPEWSEISKVCCMFNYKGAPHAVAYKKNTGFIVYSVAINGDNMRFTKEVAKLNTIPANTIVRSADIKGHIVSTGWVADLYVGDGSSRINAGIPAGSIAYNPTADEVYVGCDTGANGGRINVFKPKINDGNLEFDYLNNRELAGLPGMVNDILTVTESQIECIRRQMKE